MTAPLEGIRVVAIEHSVAGPLCSRILGELGASVIKVERPGGGDFARHWDGNVHGEGAQFWWLNRQKQSVVLDLKAAAGHDNLMTLLSSADVLVHNLAPASAARLGLDNATVEANFPHLINCQISGYGASGPAEQRKAYDMLIQAETGVMSLTGTPEQPMRVGVSISDVTTGIYSALLVLAALHERNRTGTARHLDIAMFDATLEFLGPMLLSYLNAGISYPRVPDHHHAIAPYGVLKCRDGKRILIAVEQDAEWQRFCRGVLHDAELAENEKYATNTKRVRHHQELHRIIADRLAHRDSDDAIDALTTAGLAFGRLNDVSEIANHLVAVHRGVVRPAQTRDGKRVLRLAGLAERLFERPTAPRDRPPAMGEDTTAIMAEAEGPTPAGPTPLQGPS